MLVLFYKEQSKAATKRHIDYAGALIFSVSTIALLYALLTGSQEQSWLNPTIISLIAFSLLSFLVFYFVEKRSPEPMIPLTLFTNRSVSMINLLTLLINGIVIGLVVYLPIWTQGVLGESATVAGFVLTPMSVSWTLGAVPSGRAIDYCGNIDFDDRFIFAHAFGTRFTWVSDLRVGWTDRAGDGSDYATGHGKNPGCCTRRSTRHSRCAEHVYGNL